ncbi:hypothetical protein, partial [Treponema sp. R80B11-R83G3]
MSVAFSHKSEAIKNIKELLKDKILSSISHCNDTFCLSVFAETSRILDTDGSIEDKLLTKNRKVVNNILIRSTYYKQNNDKNLQLSYYKGLERYSTGTFFKKLKYFMFIFKLNKKATFLRHYCILRIINIAVILGLFIYACVNTGIGENNILMDMQKMIHRPISILAIFIWPLMQFIHDRITTKSMYIEKIILCLLVIPLFGFTGNIILFSIALFFVSFSFQESLIITDKIILFINIKNKNINDLFNYFSWFANIVVIAIVISAN